MTKHEVLKHLLRSKRNETHQELRNVWEDIARLKIEALDLSEQLHQYPDEDQLDNLSYQELAELTEENHIIVPDVLLVESDEDQGTSTDPDLLECLKHLDVSRL